MSQGDTTLGIRVVLRNTNATTIRKENTRS
jgi:hypothetical protein